MKRFTGPKQFNFRGHNYFFSGHVPAHANQKVDWLDGRNICREYCMDLVSIETQEENNMIFRLIQQSKYFILFGNVPTRASLLYKSFLLLHLVN